MTDAVKEPAGAPVPAKPDEAAHPGAAVGAVDWLRANMSFRKMQQATIMLLLVALCVYASFESKTFWSWANIVDNLLTNAAAFGVIALGMTFVMIGGGFDLSVAATTVVCSVVLVQVMDGLSPSGHAFAVATAMAVTALVGIALGAVNGVLVAYVGVNPFVVTLSTMFIFRGIALIMTEGGQSLQVADLDLRTGFEWVYSAKFAVFEGLNQLITMALVASAIWATWRAIRRFTRFAGGAGMTVKAKAVLATGGAVLTALLYLLMRFVIWGPGYDVSMPIIVFAGTFAVGVYCLNYTRFGHYVFALGGNEEATWLAGVDTRLVKTVTYAICGLTCAIASIVLVSMTSTADASTHTGKELDVIASVIVGGTPLGGGSGGLGLTFTGLLLLRVISNLLTDFSVDSAYRMPVTGFIILVVVAIDVLVRRRSRR